MMGPRMLALKSYLLVMLFPRSTPPAGALKPSPITPPAVLRAAGTLSLTIPSFWKSKEASPWNSFSPDLTVKLSIEPGPAASPIAPDAPRRNSSKLP